MSDLETEIRVYKARYKETNQFFCDLLGISEDAFIKKYKGVRPFSVYEMFTLSETLQIDPLELYDMLPEVNRHPRGIS